MMRNKKQEGQALLLVIAAMTVALALGINVSMRTLQSVSRTTRTDTSERILSAAEGGIERALNLSPAVLNGGINNSGDCALMGSNASLDPTSGDCVVSFQTTGDPVVARATVVVSDYNYTDPSTNTYKFKVEQDSVTEVNVTGVTSSINICWTPVSQSDLYYIIYGNTGILSKKGLRSGTLGGSYDPHNFADASLNGTKYCSGNITLPIDSKGLRIKSLGGNSIVEVTGPSFPTQGSKIVSTGYLTSEMQSKKVITVYKSLPYLPSIFDYSIMSAQGSLLY